MIRTRARVRSMMARLMTMMRFLWLMEEEELQQPGEQQEVASAGSSWPGQW